MSVNDRARWDQRWGDITDEAYAPHPLLLRHEKLLSPGWGLDLACGLGQNAIWLAQRGYRMLGVDVSAVALKKAAEAARRQELAHQPQWIQADLDNWYIPAGRFDLVVVFRFLDRRLFPALQEAVRPSGLIFYQTRHRGLLRRLPEANPDFLLKPGELPDLFAGWEIVHYQEEKEEAGLIAAKTG